MSYIASLVVRFCLYAIAGLSLNILVGYCGLFSLSHAAMYGLGAYTAAILMVDFGLGFLPSLGAAMAVGAVASLFVSLPAARLRGDSFTISTIAFQVAVLGFLNNVESVTHGPYGIAGIPRPHILGFSFNALYSFTALVILITTGVIYICWAIVNSPFGRSIRAIRDDETASLALGKNVFHFRVAACALAGILVSLGGAVYASYIGYIDPTGFTLGESFMILTVVVVGGAGSLWGPVVGSGVVVFLPELLRFAAVPSTVFPNIRQIIFGSILIALMFLRPQGLAGRYRLER